MLARFLPGQQLRAGAAVRHTGPITGMPDRIAPQLTKLMEALPEGDHRAQACAR